ncbi:putative wall-associated receptor kinase-like 16 [Cannabis sativa]|nr:putative wall-associated receptor kinase-like 16 [Cannabis sativa]
MKIIIIIIIIIAFLIPNSQTTNTSSCLDRCGDVEIPFPFGSGENCYLEPKYLITCTNSTAYLTDSTIIVENISLKDGEMSVMQFVTKDCYSKKGTPQAINPYNSIWLSDFTISATKNKFVALGCDTYGTIVAYRGNRKYTTGCISSCDKIDEDQLRKSCSGVVGCCETPITSGLKNFTVWLSSFYNHTYVWDFNPCSYAFVVDESKFKFSSFEALRNTEKQPLVLDWSIGLVSCDEAVKLTNYSCKANSKCVNSNNGIGYLCQCLNGYHGNPYHPQGCQDIDECKSITSLCNNGECRNLPGTWKCECPKGFLLNATGTGCDKDFKQSHNKRALILYAALGTTIGLLALLTTSFLVWWKVKKRELTNLREKFFKQNGGLILQQQLSTQLSREESQSTKIFSEEELQRATNNFHEDRIVGKGGYGIVYKGIMPNNKVVAIKRSKLGVQTETEQFINEVTVLLQISHRNVVRLLGCCLETETPLLVYDFVSNGTLSQHIHEKSRDAQVLSWDLRVKIAEEIARVLAYLHSECSTPIIHRDVKTTNILLDENYIAKVSDFGASRLIPLNKSELTTLVQGTLGYLDPEYFQSGQLTDKSDVYSFGVVLLELLTSKKAVSFERLENERNLAMLFLKSMQEDSLIEILDKSIVQEGRIEAIKKVAKLASMCLSVKGQERPTMKEVATELEGLRIMEKHPWREENNLSPEESEYLLGDTAMVNAFQIDIDSKMYSTSTGCNNSKNCILISYNHGR